MAIVRPAPIADYKLRGDLVQIESQWVDPGDSTLGSRTVTVRVQEVPRDSQGRRAGDITYKPALTFDMTEPARLAETLSVDDPVTGQPVTISVAGIALAIEQWVTRRLDEANP